MTLNGISRKQALKKLEKNIIFLAERIINRIRSSFFCFPIQMRYHLGKSESERLFFVNFDFSPSPIPCKNDYRNSIVIESFMTIPRYEDVETILKTAEEISTERYFEYALRKVIDLININVKYEELK